MANEQRPSEEHAFTADFCELCGFPIEAWRKHLCPVGLQYELDELRRGTAWLIEMEGMHCWFSPGYRGDRWEWVSSDANEAMRFVRKVDAEIMISTFRRFDTTFFQNNRFIATEHVWL